MEDSTPEISALLLTLNEAGNIKQLIPEIRQQLTALGVTWEIVIIDGGSNDGTREVAAELGARVQLQRRYGYGGAFRDGLEAVRGKFVLCLDADCSHPPAIIPQLWRERGDLVIASRYISGGSSGGPGDRQLLSNFLNRFCRRALSINIKDFSSGYRLYRREILQPELYEGDNFGILIEALVRIVCDGYQVKEIPLEYQPRDYGISKASPIKFGIEYLQIIFNLWKVRNSMLASDYDSRAYDSIIPIQRWWQRSRFNIIKSYLGDVKGRVLDVGCGSSKIIQSMPNAVACDLSLKKLRFLRPTNKYRLCGSTFSLPFNDNTFDAVIHSEVLEHVEYSEEIFKELNRVIIPGGRLIVGTPDYGRVWWPVIEFFYERLLPNAYIGERITHFTRKSLIDNLARHGFRTLSFRYIAGAELIVKAVKVGESDSKGYC